MLKANVLDMFHGDNREKVPDMDALVINGIWAVLHKCTEGVKFIDTTYSTRKAAALKSGLLWGAYHFLHAGDAIEQAKFFLDHSEMDANTALVLDFEKSKATPTLQNARDFMSYVDDNSPGQTSCILYSGDLIRESLRPNAGGHQSTAMLGAEMFFAQHRLWLAEYGPHANIPWPWSDKSVSKMWQNPWLWQFSQSGRINTIVGDIDLNFYAGSQEDLKNNWVSLSTPTPNPATV